MAYIEQFQSLIHEGRTCNTRGTAGSCSQYIGSRMKKGKVTRERKQSLLIILKSF